MDPILSQIQLMPFTWQMTGWLTCEGQILQVVQYQALFALIGATYGGDGRSTFAVPNLKGAEPLPGMKYFIAMQGIFPSRD